MCKMLMAATALTAAAVIMAPMASAQQMGEKDFGYVAKFDDGGTERYIARYTAVIADSMWQEGHPSEPLKGWVRDTRQCRWRIETKLIRQWCQVSRSGTQFCDGAFKREWSLLKDGKGSDFVLTGLAPENCGDAAPRHASDVTNVRNQAMPNLDAAIAEDRPKLVEEMREMLKAVELSMR